MDRSRAFLYAFGFLIAGCVVALLLYFIFGQEPDPCEGDKTVCICLAVLPQERKGGFTLSVSDKGAVDVDVSGERDTAVDASSEQLDAFVACLKERGRQVTISNGVRIPLEPVGQVANRWSRESGLKLNLLPGVNEEVLQNLRIGPAVGSKSVVISDWCGPEIAGSCVTCDPKSPDDSTTEVVIELKPKSTFTRKQMAGIWAAPILDSETGEQVSPGEPWRLVDKDGKRYFYQCDKQN